MDFNVFLLRLIEIIMEKDGGKYTDSTKGTVEIVKGTKTYNIDRLYWICDTQAPKNLPNAFYFCIDTQLVYQPFSSDFGPLNLGMTFKYIRELERLLSNK